MRAENTIYILPKPGSPLKLRGGCRLAVEGRITYARGQPSEAVALTDGARRLGENLLLARRQQRRDGLSARTKKTISIQRQMLTRVERGRLWWAGEGGTRT